MTVRESEIDKVSVTAMLGVGHVNVDMTPVSLSTMDLIGKEITQLGSTQPPPPSQPANSFNPQLVSPSPHYPDFMEIAGPWMSLLVFTSSFESL